MIKPSIGRVVLYQPHEADQVVNHGDQPMAATVSYVWSDRMVNLSIADHDGNTFTKTSVTLAQDDDAVEPGMCEWMPYQKEQATKQEEKEPLGTDYTGCDGEKTPEAAA